MNRHLPYFIVLLLSLSSWFGEVAHACHRSGHTSGTSCQQAPLEIQTFTVEPVPSSPGIVRIDWQINGMDDYLTHPDRANFQAYIFGPFNRALDDNHCGMIRDPSGIERFLLVDAETGGDFTSSRLPNQLERDFNENGVKCEGDLGNCRGYQESPEQPIYCRVSFMDIQSMGGTVYTRVHEPNATFTVVATRNGTDWVTEDQTIDFTDPTVAEPTHISLISASINDGQDRPIKLAYSYGGALDFEEPKGCICISGCNPDGTLSSSSGTVEVECEMINRTYQITKGFWAVIVPISYMGFPLEARVEGIGGHQTATAWVHIGPAELKLLKFPFTPDSDCRPATTDCPGNQALSGTIKRTIEVTKDDKETVLATASDLPWVNRVKLMAKDNETGSWNEVQSLPGGNATVNFNTERSHRYTEWKMTIVDLDGSQRLIGSVLSDAIYSSNVVANPYTPSLGASLQCSNWSYDYTYDFCGGGDLELNDCCIPDPSGKKGTGVGRCHHDSEEGVWDCRNYSVTLGVIWKAQHVKGLEMRCQGIGENHAERVVSIPVDENSYAEQTQAASVQVGGEAANCRAFAKLFDGTEISSDLLYAQREAGYCDERDRAYPRCIDPDDTNLTHDGPSITSDERFDALSCRHDRIQVYLDESCSGIWPFRKCFKRINKREGDAPPSIEQGSRTAASSCTTVASVSSALTVSEVSKDSVKSGKGTMWYKQDLRSKSRKKRRPQGWWDKWSDRLPDYLPSGFPYNDQGSNQNSSQNTGTQAQGTQGTSSKQGAFPRDPRMERGGL